MTTILAGAALVLPTQLVTTGWVELEGDRIVHVGSGVPPRSADVDLGGGYLAPGFVDIHSHGGGGSTVVGGDPDAVAGFARAHREHGTTTIVASLVSAHPDALARDVAALAELAQEGVIAGIHLEGPWIAPEYKGAHDPATLRDPDPEEVDALLRIGRGTIRMVTLAPEYPHGLDAVARFAAAGVIPAVGHTNATYAQTRAAIEAGASCSTHLFNAMRPVNHREPGPVVALTEDERVTNELILDGVHVHAAAAAFAARAAQGRVVLVTDAMTAAAGQDGDYLLGDLPVIVTDGVARLVDGGAIAGSTLTLDHAVRFAVQQVGLDLPQAIAAASATPARMLGLADRGTLTPGTRADLVHLDDGLALTRVWRAGAAVPR